MSSTDERAPIISAPPAAVFAVVATIAVIGLIESGRRFGFLVPAPFLLLFGTVAIGSGFAGLRAGLTVASIAAVFIVYSAMQNFGPSSLTGSVVTIVVGTGIAYLIAYLLGYSRDRRIELTNRLNASRSKLLAAQEELAKKVELRTEQLGAISTELSSVRNRLDSAIEHSPVGVVVIGTNRLIESANPAALQMLGLKSMPEADLDVARFLQQYELYSTNGERMEFGRGPLTDALDKGIVNDNVEFRLVRPDRTFGWYRGSMAPVFSSDNTVSGATVIMADVTEAKDAATAMRELSQKLMRVQEDERTSLAYELHDEIGQNLTALSLNLHALLNDPENRSVLTESIAQVEELTRTVRNLSVELRPAMLDDLGLVAALRWYLTRQKQRSGHGVTFDANVTLGRLSAEVTTASFRIVQEAVTNAMKHANCNTLTVRLYNEDGGLCIEVADDGRGFDVRKQTTARSYDRGLGLLSMSERVGQLGGVFEIDSAPGRGTRIVACFPIR